MKIGSKIKPRSGKPRHVPVHGTEYVFAPVKDNAGETHFVAEVTNPDHAELLLANGAFYPFGKDRQQQPKLTRGGQDNGGENPPAPPELYQPEVLAEAQALLDNSIEAMGTAIGSVSSLDVLRCALALERTTSARKGAIALLDSALLGAQQAGVA